MTVSPGVRLETYEIVAPIASGGMGEVWLARDLRLDRKVAIKILPANVTRDEGRVARFRHEARAASALNHPNVCTIYTLGEAADGRVFIAMEYIDGDTLRHRLSAGPLSVRQALEVTQQIASALATAHAVGIIHRDVKPENVMIRADGLVKVLDFGLAKLDPTIATIELAGVTHTALSTNDRTVMGTIAYMSPEHAAGEPPLDARTDLFSLGAVLYEMVTARQAFAGNSTAIVYDAILNRTPASPMRLNADVPSRLEEIINKALEKDRDLRYHSASELRADLLRLRRDTDAHGSVVHAGGSPAIHRASRPGLRNALVLGVLISAALLVLAILWRLHAPAVSLELQEVQLTTNSSEDPVTAAALSPDGKYVAYADRAGIHVRVIESRETNAVPKHDFGSVNRVAWFADGSKVVVSGSGVSVAAKPSIWVVPLIGGGSRKIQDDGIEASVSTDGDRIAFVAPDRQSLWTMRANADELQKVVAAGLGETLHLPRFLHDGTHLVYGRVRTLVGDGATLKLEVLLESRDSNGTISVLLSDPGLRGAAFLPDGRLLYSLVTEPLLDRGATLWEAYTDPRTGIVRGKPRRISNAEETAAFVQLTSSADGKRVACVKTNPQQDVYVANLSADGSPLNARRFTLDDSNDFVTNWTTDGKAVFFTSNRNGTYDIFKQGLDQAVPEVVVGGPDDEMGPTAVSPDGGWFYYQVQPRGWRTLTTRGGVTTMRVAISGGPPQRIGEPGSDTALCARAPSAVCVLVKREGDQVVFYDLSVRGIGRKITAADVGSSSPFYAPSMAPDGTRVAIMMAAERRVRIVSLVGEPVRDVAIEGRSLDRSYFHWTPDGTGWYLSSTSAAPAGGTDILRVDLNGQAKTVWHQTAAMPSAAIPSPDSRRLAFTNATTVSNVWLLKH